MMWNNSSSEPDTVVRTQVQLLRTRASDEEKAWRVVLLHDPCVYCGGVAQGLDHILPKSSYGPNTWENRAPACTACDNAKAHYLLLPFLLGVHQTHTTDVPRREGRAAAQARVRAEIAELFYHGNVRFTYGISAKQRALTARQKEA